MDNEIQQDTPQTHPLTQTPPTVPGSTNWVNKISFILLTIVIVVGLVFAGIQIGKNQSPNQQQFLFQPSPTPISSPTVFPTIINPTRALLDWQLYRNNNYGFEFMHPNNMEFINTNTANDKYITGRMGGAFSTSEYLDMNIEIGDSPAVSTLEKNGYQDETGLTKGLITVAGMKTTTYSGMGGEGANYPFMIFSLQNGSTVYYFYLSTKDGWSTVDQILSTFKFTN